MPYLVMPMGLLVSAEAAQSALHLVGRFLLMVSMALFLSYLLFMLGAVVVSGLLARFAPSAGVSRTTYQPHRAVRSPRHRGATSTPRAAATEHGRREQRP
ncbi:hypothetical protein SAT01_27740 [Sinomonas atrocyanea]|nr:hypothetical protein SAT01_27740 [Sinomonas atrocyanea]GGG59221.1 hypothetical protein GCM10007172_07610 [Sinomonas atrocyanea]